ncbi:MAG TPA: hypothetical protein VMW89_09635 [Desulfatiglandales bacterium]|nr:hypothetical protein [Desulfatiglandales bacterium]
MDEELQRFRRNKDKGERGILQYFSDDPTQFESAGTHRMSLAEGSEALGFELHAIPIE